MTHHWQRAQACSVIGAAHQRQGKPCQDASLTTRLKAGADTLQLLVVADGHGGLHYRLSHRGSALACQMAQEAVEAWLARTPLIEAERWRQLLEVELPASIQKRWLQAIEADWRQQPDAQEQTFSALLYGSTLGVVILAPHWWGCTGIGDWDLAAVDLKGHASLLSEEREHGGSEATGSLCQPHDQQAWRLRAQLQRLDDRTNLRALVLSTDGVRKSCTTDADYLQLCSGVVDLEDSRELEQGLALITRDGSGDDVSLAIALRQHQPGARPVLRRRSPGWWLLLAATLLGLGGWLLARRETPLQAQARELCARPDQIQTSLNQRRAQFTAMLNEPERASQLRQQQSTDPLGALIATSQDEPVPGCAALNTELARQWRQARTPAAPAKGKMPAAAAPGNP